MGFIKIFLKEAIKRQAIANFDRLNTNVVF